MPLIVLTVECIFVFPAFFEFRTSPGQSSNPKNHQTESIPSPHGGMPLSTSSCCGPCDKWILFIQISVFTPIFGLMTSGKRNWERNKIRDEGDGKRDGRGKSKGSQGPSISIHHWLPRGTEIYLHMLLVLIVRALCGKAAMAWVWWLYLSVTDPSQTGA